MMPFNPPPEPPDFDKKVRQTGNAWLAKNPNPKKGTRDYWSPFKSYLADGFNNLCGYSVMYEPVGTVDHYRSRENYRNLAYEWSNLGITVPKRENCTLRLKAFPHKHLSHSFFNNTRK
jgi:hypothetical protein